MKVKSVKTKILEEVGFLLPTKKLLSSKEKVEIMEQFLMMPAYQIVTLQQDGRKPSFVQQIAKLLYNNNLEEYFNVLKCAEIWQQRKKKIKVLFLNKSYCWE